MEWMMQERVDLARSHGLTRWPGVLMQPEDSLAHRWAVGVSQDGVPVDLTGWQVTAYMTRQDGVCVPVPGEACGSAAGVTLLAACYACPGELKGMLQVSKDDIRVTLSKGVWNVGRKQGEKVADPAQLVPSLPELLAQIDAMQMATAACQDATTAAAEVVTTATPAIMPDVTGAMVSMSDAAARPAVQLVSTINPAQPGTGDPSPDNVRPLPGWDAVNLTRTGRNLISHLDYVKQEGHKSTVISGDVIDVTVPSQYDFGNIPVQLKAGVTYTLVIDWEVYGRDDASTGSTRASYYIGKAGTTSAYIHTSANGVNRVVKQYAFEEDMTGRISWCPNNGSSLPACSRSSIMLLEGEYTADTAPAFEPCDKLTLTAALPETVYGGTLDWTTGLLTVTHFAKMYDGTEAWVDLGNGMTYKLPDSILTKAMTNNEAFYHLCSHYKPARYRAPADQADMSCYTINGHTLCIKDTSVGTLDGLKAYLAAQAAAGTPVTIVHPYKPAYRTTHQLNPQTLEMLKGYNAVWSDTGDTSVVYIADTKMYIDGKFAELQNAILAQGANI